MTRNDLVTFDGITQSINEWALDYGITPQTIMRRLHDGASFQIAITKPIPSRPGDQLPEPIVVRPRVIKVSKPRVVDRYIHHGKSHTVTEWAAITGISAETMRSRIKAGYSMADVLRKGNFPKGRRSNFKGGRQRRPAKLYTFNGIARSLSQWSIHTGIQYATLLRRLKQGVTIEHALTAKHGERRLAVHSIGGVSKTLPQWAAHAGIKYNALIARIHKGRSLAEAVAMNTPRLLLALPLEINPDVNAHHTDAPGQHVQGLPVFALSDIHHGRIEEECTDEQSDDQNATAAIAADSIVRITTPHPNHSYQNPDSARLATWDALFNRGVVSDLTASVGTGGGSTVQESTNIGISE